MGHLGRFLAYSPQKGLFWLWRNTSTPPLYQFGGWKNENEYPGDLDLYQNSQPRKKNFQKRVKFWFYPK